jgi:hypothetical protein
LNRLPHAHILILLEDEYKPRNVDDYDSICSAEIPNKELHPEAYKTVTEMMIHGPCGKINPKSPCMVDGVCSKQFPKDFNEYTTENADGYPEYRRRDNKVTHPVKIHDIKNKNKDAENFITFEVDNRWIVPHNLYLSTKYNCHINTEVCSSVILSIIRILI